MPSDPEKVKICLEKGGKKMQQTDSEVPRMKSIRWCAAHGYATEHSLRTLKREGRLPGIQVGKKFFVNVDELAKIFSNTKKEE